MTDPTRTGPERRWTAQGALVRNVVTPAAVLLAFLAFHPTVGAALSATFAAFACALVHLAVREPDAARIRAQGSASRFDLHVRVACGLLVGLIVAAAYVGSAHNGPMLALALLIACVLACAAKAVDGRPRQEAPGAHPGPARECPAGSG